MQNDYSSYTNSTKINVINVISVCVCVCKLLETRRFNTFASQQKARFCTFLPSVSAVRDRGTWHTIRDQVQRSYLIVWDTESDQLCVPVFDMARG